MKGHLHNNCLFYILTINCKYLSFSLSLAFQLRILNLAGVQNGRTISLKNNSVLIKSVFFWGLFPRSPSFLCQSLVLHSLCLLHCLYFLCYIFVIERKSLLISVLKPWHTYAHYHPDRSSNWTHKSLKKQSFTQKYSFWSLFSKMKVTCMPIASFMSWLFLSYIIFSL